jgi:hypothetical protein
MKIWHPEKWSDFTKKNGLILFDIASFIKKCGAIVRPVH